MHVSALDHPGASPGRRVSWLLAPYFLLFTLFWLLPLIGGVRLSLESNVLFGDAEFVGLKHYRDLIGDGRFLKALVNTALFAAGGMLIILPLALLLAQALKTTHRRLRPWLMFALLVPGLTPPVVLALLFLLVFHGEAGLLNQWFVLPLGGTAINWLKDPSFILPALVLQSVWRWTGFITFFFVSAMNAVPTALYEAAHLETDSRWLIWRSVTLPRLRPVIFFAAIYLTIDAFSLFSGAYVLLGGSGGTADAGLLLVTYIYHQAFVLGQFATASAVSVLIAPLLLALLWVGFAVVKRR